MKSILKKSAITVTGILSILTLVFSIIGFSIKIDQHLKGYQAPAGIFLGFLLSTAVYFLIVRRNYRKKLDATILENQLKDNKISNLEVEVKHNKNAMKFKDNRISDLERTFILLSDDCNKINEEQLKLYSINDQLEKVVNRLRFENKELYAVIQKSCDVIKNKNDKNYRLQAHINKLIKKLEAQVKQNIQLSLDRDKHIKHLQKARRKIKMFDQEQIENSKWMKFLEVNPLPEIEEPQEKAVA